MKKFNSTFVFIFLIISSFATTSCKEKSKNPAEPEKQMTVVEYYGALKVSGNKIVDKNGNSVSLKGMSLFWSQWGGKYFNKECVKWLRDDWMCSIVRAPLGVESGGYLTNKTAEYKKITDVIDAAIELGIYVIVDWHDHNAQDHLSDAKEFFKNISAAYGDKPNLIYEIYNEPVNVEWNNIIKPYAEEVIKTIRENDTDNLIVVGTPTWSQDVDKAALNPINDTNVAYSLHFYTGTHRQSLRDKATTALNKGIALFVTEFGISEASGNGNIDMTETNKWTSFMVQYNLSWCNWSIIDKNETSAALLPGASANGGWTESNLSQSGKILRDYIRNQNSELFQTINAQNN